MVKTFVPIFLALIFGLPFCGAFYPVLAAEKPAAKLLFLFFAPIIFLALFTIISGFLSRPFQKAIVAGKFPRDLKHFVYGPRRLYGLCWTSVYYFVPLYYVVLTIPELRKIVFRLFGYKGNVNFTIYPDSWIRDLPLLSFGEGSYVANRATIGTNICLKSGDIFVDKISIGKKSLVGHLAMVAPGVEVQDGAEIGGNVVLGIRTRIQKNAKVAPRAGVNHGVDLGENSEIGSMSYIGTRTIIKGNIKIPAGANIPAGSTINTQEDLSKFISSETNFLNEVREQMSSLYQQGDLPVGPPDERNNVHDIREKIG
jgi:acetyltransferase-like isoleucine patch superfamily enzyme